MYCALIVDDESIIRRGLRCMIPWPSLGFSEVREAASAEAALKITEEMRVDLIITDICMPGMDGLEMTRRLLALQPDIRIVVVTGYDNFQYAQRCCQLGVKHLLIKPVDESELTRLIASLVDEMEKEGIPGAREQEGRRKTELSQRMLLESILVGLSKGACTREDLTTLQNLAGIREHEKVCALLLSPAIELSDEWRAHRTLLIISIARLLSGLAESGHAGYCFARDNQAVVLLKASGGMEAETFAENAAMLVEGEYGMPCALGVGRWGDLNEFSQSISQAEDALRHFGRTAPGRLVKMALEIIRARFNSDISVAAISEELHVSTNYFSRLFKHEMGEGCNEYITSVRIKAAKKLLQESGLRCYEVAEAVGYRDANYFSLSFKKNTGVSPEQFRLSAGAPQA
jgi:YesN/AraC family two-component response regulator